MHAVLVMIESNVLDFSFSATEALVLRDQPISSQFEVYQSSLNTMYACAGGMWMAVLVEWCVYPTKQKDRYLMLIHHLVTLALLGGSYIGGVQAVGGLVLFLHDTCDIVVMVLKLAAKYNMPEYMLNTTYVITLMTWMYTRIYLFGYHLVFQDIAMSYILMGQGEVTTGLYIMTTGLMFLAGAHVWWLVLLLKLPCNPPNKWETGYEQ